MPAAKFVKNLLVKTPMYLLKNVISILIVSSNPLQNNITAHTTKHNQIMAFGQLKADYNLSLYLKKERFFICRHRVY